MVAGNSLRARWGALTGIWRRRTLTIGGIALAVVLVLAWAFRDQPVPADFATVTRGDLMLTIDDEGETRLKEAYVVSAPVAGRVERIEIDVGDQVVAGETVLARFIPSDPAIQDARARAEADAGVRLARAERAKAAAELEFADAELKRATELRKQGTISEATLDRARLAVKTARAALEQSTAALAKRQADLDSARAALSSTRAGGQPMIAVTSPVSGRVMKRMQESSQLIAAGTPLLEVGNPAELEIVTDLLSADAVRVREGAEVIIEEWGGQEPLRGTVRRVEPFGFTKISALGIEEQRVNVITDFVSPREKWASLGHGYRVMTRMVVSQRRGVLKVPVSALFRTGEDWTVFAVNDRRAVVRKVTVGLRNPLEAEILDGLTEKDQVILHPSDRIADGVTVEPRA